MQSNSLTVSIPSLALELGTLANHHAGKMSRNQGLLLALQSGILKESQKTTF